MADACSLLAIQRFRQPCVNELNKKTGTSDSRCRNRSIRLGGRRTGKPGLEITHHIAVGNGNQITVNVSVKILTDEPHGTIRHQCVDATDMHALRTGLSIVTVMPTHTGRRGGIQITAVRPDIITVIMGPFVDPVAIASLAVAAAVEALRTMGLYKPPGVAETIDWATALGQLGVRELNDAVVESTLGVVLKYREDHERVREHGVAQLVKQAFDRGMHQN